MAVPTSLTLKNSRSYILDLQDQFKPAIPLDVQDLHRREALLLTTQEWLVCRIQPLLLLLSRADRATSHKQPLSPSNPQSFNSLSSHSRESDIEFARRFSRHLEDQWAAYPDDAAKEIDEIIFRSVFGDWKSTWMNTGGGQRRGEGQGAMSIRVRSLESRVCDVAMLGRALVGISEWVVTLKRELDMEIEMQ